MSQVEDDFELPESSQSLAVATSESARQKRKIAALEEKLQVLESGHAAKQRETNYYMSQGRALRRIVTLFDNIEDLIRENDRRCDLDGEDENMTVDQDRLQTGYIALNHALPWFHSKASELDMENVEFSYMLKKLRQGADSARGDDTSKLKSLVADWINRELKPDPLVDPDDKHCRGFVNDACGRLLCPTELDWNSPIVRAGIRDRTDDYVVTEMSWPAFLYEKYTANQDNLEEGLFKSTLLLQAFKAIFTSPSSARDVAGDGDAANIIETNRRAKKDVHSSMKVKTHLRFALSSVTSWRPIDGDFDYKLFWQNIVDFFEIPPGRLAQQKVKRLLAWWTRKVFGTSRRAELSDGAKARMSVNALATQRAQLDDALFDSE
ncbi:hypothetical protein DEU56DRAFT_737359 [Suillus clintonianus]|uniref:uncharacterized protein n=1 Tax=Suillus clintonianus TaxID=1904413 RepID=UPI001B873887|nr:uncharacterized protein DEU56DRAFT_737359 [Suillus clintonianus]KAG2135973.1 hypothetical protein DEU56DRAFT_737359 [Suillus clintonianus]